MKKVIKIVTTLFIFIGFIMIVNLKAFAYETTYDNNYTRTGYHLELNYSFVHDHEATLAKCDYIVCRMSNNLNPSADQLYSAVYKSSSRLTGSFSTDMSHMVWGYDLSQTTYTVGNIGLFFKADNCDNVGYFPLACPYNNAANNRTGYTYLYLYYSWCDIEQKYYFIGFSHYWLATYPSGGGTIEYVLSPYSHTINVYNIVPNNYSVQYDGNGATSGTMPATGYSFDTAYSLPANQYSKQYTVNYDPGGGTSPIASDTATATFNGWIDNNSIIYNGNAYGYSQFNAPYYANKYADLKNAFGYNKYSLIAHYLIYGQSEGRSAVKSGNDTTSGLYPDGATIENLTPVNGQTLTLYADWTNAAITLPKPVREGYTFKGWYDKQSNGTLIGYAGGSYTPTSNKTLYAYWIDDTAPSIDDLTPDDDPTVKTITENSTSIEYDWINHAVNLHFKGIDSGSGISSIKLYDNNNVLLKSGTEEIKYTVTEENVTDYKLIAVDKAGNTTTVSVKVRIDYNAPDSAGRTITDGSDYVSKIITVKATDDLSGLTKFVLEKLDGSNWVASQNINVSSISGCMSAQKSFTVNLSDYKYKYRIAYYDYAGNIYYSDEFYVMPVTVKATVSKLNGTSAGNNETLTFIQNGDMTATINVTLGGYVEYVTYEFADELNHAGETHTISLTQTSTDGKGIAADTLSFILPENLELGESHLIKVTGYRGDEKVEQFLYVKLDEVDFSRLRTRIRYQSGQMGK